MFPALCPQCRKVTHLPKSRLNQTVQCGECGGEFKAEKPFEKGCFAAGLFCLATFALLGWLLFHNFQEAKKEKEAEEKRAELRREWAKEDASSGDTHGAWAYIQTAVKQRLKSPKSASFPFGGHRSVQPLGDGRYRFSSYVDARNSFDAEIRTSFSGVIKRVPGGWRIESLQLSE